MESILSTIKHLLGVDEDFTHFDTDIITNINSAFMTLNQLGVGTPNFFITSKADKWQEFVGNRKDLEGVRVYVYVKTKLTFDPPQNSFLVEALKQQATELEWRLNIQLGKEA